MQRQRCHHGSATAVPVSGTAALAQVLIWTSIQYPLPVAAPNTIRRERKKPSISILFCSFLLMPFVNTKPLHSATATQCRCHFSQGLGVVRRRHSVAPLGQAARQRQARRRRWQQQRRRRGGRRERRRALDLQRPLGALAPGAGRVGQLGHDRRGEREH